MDNFHEFVDKYRKQRHDFMNDIQVIYGYLQLNKKDESIQYIEKIVRQNKSISKMYALGDYNFAFFMEEVLGRLWKSESIVELDVEIDSFSKEVFLNEYNKKINLVNNIINELENNKCKFVYIYIFEDELGESLLISNNESCINELDWMEDWENLNTEIQDIDVYKYTDREKIAYRLTFTS